METGQNNAFIEVSESSKTVDGGRILRFMRNPLEALGLTEKEWLYGVLGLAASFLGYLIWVLLFGGRIAELLYSFMPFGGMFAPTKLTFAIFGRMFGIGLLSMAALLGALWLTGWWRSGVQPSWKTFLAQLGGMQYIAGAGFLLAGIVSFSFPFSILVLGVTLLSSLVLSVYGGAEASGVSRERTSSYMILSVALYLVLLGVLVNLFF